MTSRANNHLRIQTSPVSSPPSGDDSESPPSITQSSTHSSSSSSSETDTPMTPQNPIMTPYRREELAVQFVEGLGLQWLELSTSQKIRAKKIQSSEFTWSPSRGEAPPNKRYTTTFKKEWEAFVQGLPDDHRAMLSTLVNVFFNEEAILNVMAIHQQRSGVCSSHASVLFQHYVQSCRIGFHAENHEMLDVSTYIRDHLAKDNQKKYVLEGVTGKGSSELVQLFTNTDEDDYKECKPVKKDKFKEYHDQKIREIFEFFVKNQEPGLVSCFRVGPEFSQHVILQGELDRKGYDKIVAQRSGKANLHAMVLLGAYHLDDSGYWFLLQNTHKDDYFKLVNGEYLASCNARVYFASKEADMSLKGNYEVIDGEYIEAAFDLDECMPEPHAEG